MGEKNYSKIWEQFATFPCQTNGKKPATKRGFKDALFGQDVMSFIKQGYNVALACEMSNVVVLDLDYHDSNSTAIEDIRDLEKVLGVLPLTLRQSTASGKGQHLIFSAKGITKPIGKIGKFCDVKYSGYIMVAPSTINGRQYEITEGVFSNGDILIAELPERWLDYLNKDVPANNTVVDYSNLPKKTYSDINIDELFKNCAFLRYCKDNAETLNEPAWFSMITILAQIENSDELIHKLSEPYAKYSYEETQSKIDRARTFGYSQSCKYLSETFSEICKNCDLAENREVYHG